MNPISSKFWKADITSGFLVFLIALPLCLGISMASGFPPVAGILTAIIGGIISTFLGSARLTIKGPAAGLIVIALGAVTELSQGDQVAGYRRALAVGVVAGLLQIALALSRAGVVGQLMPSSVVHGMLAAIGVIIISKQTHTLLGVTPQAKEPLHLLAEVPHSISQLNPEVFAIGLLSLVILFGLPLIKSKWVKQIPGPMVVLAVAVPLGVVFNLATEHNYSLAGHIYHLGPKYLIRLPGSLLGALSFPDFSMITSSVSIKYIVMFTLVGSIESLLSVTAVDSLDPEKHSSDLNSDLLSVGVGNTLAALVGGLPMISEIVRSKANIDNGAKTAGANFFHGLFLLLSVALIPGILQQIPLAALAAMLIYTGLRLASPKEFKHAYHVGPEQLLLFVTTMMVTLMTDLLVGVGVGLALKVVLHIKNGAPFGSLFKSVLKERFEGDTLLLEVRDAAIFTNYLGLSRRLNSVDSKVRKVVIDFENAWVVDHTVLEKLHGIADRWNDRELIIVGLENHIPMSNHHLAARRRVREDAIA
ncbi:MAG: SulP family inorganic anion transporter [Blastocatellia bacterium]|nr:SulP family inorganic anion transporter [Blastocatellia bacterium]